MMLLRRIAGGPLRVGVVVGFLFGSWNVLYAWLFPLADDTPGALLMFYGPMFAVWAAAAFVAAGRTGRVSTGVTTGAVVASATFCVYDLLVVLRVNLFLAFITRGLPWILFWRLGAVRCGRVAAIYPARSHTRRHPGEASSDVERVAFGLVSA